MQKEQRLGEIRRLLQNSVCTSSNDVRRKLIELFGADAIPSLETIRKDLQEIGTAWVPQPFGDSRRIVVDDELSPMYIVSEIAERVYLDVMTAKAARNICVIRCNPGTNHAIALLLTDLIEMQEGWGAIGVFEGAYRYVSIVCLTDDHANTWAQRIFRMARGTWKPGDQ